MIEILQQKLNYSFQNHQLLECALTHRSYLNENPEYTLGHNERLEFLGDTILEFIASRYLYRRQPELNEGFMTRLRAGLVRTETLADFAREYELGPLIRMARGEEDTGGRERQSLLCDAFEALIGAIYLDSGELEIVQDILLPLFDPVLESIIEYETDKDPKSLFQEWSQEVLGITPLYQTIHTSGTEHQRQFTVEVLINQTPVGWGNGKSKQIAEQAAARQALRSAVGV